MKFLVKFLVFFLKSREVLEWGLFGNVFTFYLKRFSSMSGENIKYCSVLPGAKIHSADIEQGDTIR